MSWRDDAAFLIKGHEGLRLKPYLDTVGKTTIGYGRNLDDRGISQKTANQMFEEDLAVAESDARAVFPTLDNLSDRRKIVLVDMAFNLGRVRLARFKKMLRWLRAGDFNRAADEMLLSVWANQVGRRAERLAEYMRQG
jgi:lysozyme